MENPNIDRQDAENNDRAEYSDRVDRFFKDVYNREIALDILKGWRELLLAFRAEFGEDADIYEDVSDFGELRDKFNIARQEIG
jgi:hypothetical protein